MVKDKKCTRAVVSGTGTFVYSGFAVDPGTSVVGWSYLTVMVLNGSLDSLRLSSGSFKVRGDLPHRLEQIANLLPSLLKWRSTVSILEQPFVSRNWSTAIVLAYSRGVIMAFLSARSLRLFDFHSARIKRFFNGIIKEDVLRVLNVELGLGLISTDASDAMSMNLIFLCEELLGIRRFLNAAQYLRDSNVN